MSIRIFLLMPLLLGLSVNGWAAHCTVTVTAPASIQATIDAASFGDVVCLDDSGGDFLQSVVFGPEDSGITLSAEDGDLPVMDGLLAAVDAIVLLDGVSDVTIEYLQIENYGAAAFTQPGNAIQAWDVSTSNITISNNIMDEFSWNAVLVGSEGGFIHDHWMVKNNIVTDADFVGIELTNCEECTIMQNDVDPSALGIVVQARSTSTTGVGIYDVVIDGVNVLHNAVEDAGIGIYVLSFTGHPTNFTPITDASTLLSSVNISHNAVTGSGGAGIRFWAFNAAATARNGRIMRNQITCDTATPGIEVLESGSGQTATVKNAKVVNNSFGGVCDPEYTDEGEDTKLPPGLGPYDLP